MPRLRFVGVVVAPACLGVNILRIYARNADREIQVQAGNVAGFCTNQHTLLRRFDYRARYRDGEARAGAAGRAGAARPAGVDEVNLTVKIFDALNQQFGIIARRSGHERGAKAC